VSGKVEWLVEYRDGDRGWGTWSHSLMAKVDAEQSAHAAVRLGYKGVRIVPLTRGKPIPVKL
jgi:hypothetical protein